VAWAALQHYEKQTSPAGLTRGPEGATIASRRSILLLSSQTFM
jgi:hypothetical protein